MSKWLRTQTKLFGYIAAMIVATSFAFGAMVIQFGRDNVAGIIHPIQTTVAEKFSDAPPTPTPNPPNFTMQVKALSECESYTCKLPIVINNDGGEKVGFNLKVNHSQFRWVDTTDNPKANVLDTALFKHDFSLLVRPITASGVRTSSLWMRGKIELGNVPGIKFPNFVAERVDRQTSPVELSNEMFWLAPNGTFEQVTLVEGQDWFTWVSNRLGVGPFNPTSAKPAIRHVVVGRDGNNVERLLLGLEPNGAQVKSVNIYADEGICAYLPPYFQAKSAQSATTSSYCGLDFDTGELLLRDNEKVFLDLRLCQEGVMQDSTNIEVTVHYSAEPPADKAIGTIPIETSKLDLCTP